MNKLKIGLEEEKVLSNDDDLVLTGQHGQYLIMQKMGKGGNG